MKLKFIEAGEIVSTHGVRGEIKLLPWVDSPEFMLKFKRVNIDGADYKIVRCRVQQTCNLLQLEGVTSMDSAQSFRGKIVKIYRDDIGPETVFAAELIGIDVYYQNMTIGTVTDVLDYPGNKVYVVSGKEKYMIPAVKEFVKTIDLDLNRMEVQLIEGMNVDED